MHARRAAPLIPAGADPPRKRARPAADAADARRSPWAPPLLPCMPESTRGSPARCRRHAGRRRVRRFRRPPPRRRRGRRLRSPRDERRAPRGQAEDRPRQKHTWLRELRAWRKTPAGASAQPASFAPLAADALAMIVGPGSCAWSPSIGGRAQTRARRTWARRRRSAPGSCTQSAYFTIRTLEVLDRAGG